MVFHPDHTTRFLKERDWPLRNEKHGNLISTQSAEPKKETPKPAEGQVIKIGGNLENSGNASPSKFQSPITAFYNNEYTKPYEPSNFMKQSILGKRAHPESIQ